MATVNKNFKVKNGLVVEGTTATVNNFDILTKKQADQDYIVGLIGGTATAANTPDTVVKRDGSGNFAAGTITASITGNVTGNVTGTVSDISNHDTGDLAEGTNLYYTDARARLAINAGTGIDYNPATGYIDANLGTGLGLDGSSQIEIDRTTVDTWYDAAGDAADAQTAAIAHTDAREIAITAAYESYADTAESDAVTTANAYTDGRETAITAAYQSYADTAEADARAYADQKVADLVDSAPALLDTLNELAAAIGDDPNYAANLATSVGEKVAKAGDIMTGALVLHADPANNLEAATKQYVDTAETDAVSSANSYTDGEITTALSTAQGYANTAEADANSYTDGEITDALVTAQGYASTAQTNAETFATNAINALDTDAIEEGSANLYFTASRAKTSAAELLTGASLTNITITGTGAGLTITAENGVADSDTDDLTEGTTNLYFTDQRAVDALQGTDSMFTTVSIDEIALQVAATLSAPTAGIQTAYSWAKADYRSAEFLVKVAYGDHTEISKVLLTLDVNDNIAITEYGIVGTNGSASSISASILTDDVQLRVQTTNNSSTVTVVGTLLA